MTNERAKWREEIRKISVLLPSTSRCDVVDVIKWLVPYLNPYGRNSIEKPFLKDGHIWEVIDSIDVMTRDDEEYMDAGGDQELFAKTKLLRDYLVLLLKFDWERSKREVRKHWTVKLLIIAGVLMPCLLLGMQFYFVGKFDSYFFLDLTVFILFPIVIGVFMYIGEDSDSKVAKFLKWAYYLGFAAYLIVYLKRMFINNNMEIDFWIIPLLLLFSFIANGIYFSFKNSISKEYINALKQLQDEYRG